MTRSCQLGGFSEISSVTLKPEKKPGAADPVLSIGTQGLVPPYLHVGQLHSASSQFDELLLCLHNGMIRWIEVEQDDVPDFSMDDIWVELMISFADIDRVN